jgi:hypothetical protein
MRVRLNTLPISAKRCALRPAQKSLNDVSVLLEEHYASQKDAVPVSR